MSVNATENNMSQNGNLLQVSPFQLPRWGRGHSFCKEPTPPSYKMAFSVTTKWQRSSNALQNGCAQPPPWPEQTLGKSCQHVSLTKIIEPFCRAPTPPVRQPSTKLKSSRNSNTISILLPYKQIDQRKGVTFAIGCIAKLYNTTQIKDNQSLQNGGSKSCYDVVCHFVISCMHQKNSIIEPTNSSSTKWLFQSLHNGEAQPFLLQNGFSNLYKMGRHNPCTTKNSPYKMALGQMNP